MGNFPGGPAAKSAPHAGDPDWVPGQGTRSHRPQLKKDSACHNKDPAQPNKYLKTERAEEAHHPEPPSQSPSLTTAQFHLRTLPEDDARVTGGSRRVGGESG